MSDHISGPRALAEPIADITDVYAFPSPERPGHLVLVMNTLPFAKSSDTLSDGLIYRFRLRPLTAEPAGAIAPRSPSAGASSCSTASSPSRSTPAPAVRWNRTGPARPRRRHRLVPGERRARWPAHGVRVFAGPRWDPFMMDAPAALKTIATGKLAFTDPGSIYLDGKNVLSLVVEIDNELFDGAELVGVVAETLTRGKFNVRIERVGRPEVKNMMLGPKQHDQVNRDLEIRDIYNMEDAFSLGESYQGAYRARLNANLAFWDGIDGKTDWDADSNGDHPLTKLVLADYLVVDLTKPYVEHGSFLEIELAARRGEAHETCGGRALNDDVMDTIFTQLINAGNGPIIRDGVDRATRPATQHVPVPGRAEPRPARRRPSTTTDDGTERHERCDAGRPRARRHPERRAARATLAVRRHLPAAAHRRPRRRTRAGATTASHWSTRDSRPPILPTTPGSRSPSPIRAWRRSACRRSRSTASPRSSARAWRRVPAELGDVGESSPDNWEQPLGTGEVHVAIAALSPDAARLEAVLDRARRAHEEVPGVELIWRQDCYQLPTGRTSFGFKDGIGQPAVEGSGIPPTNPKERPLKAGEIILGYPDETGELPPMPSPDVLGRNGTYVVFRKLHTRVAAYRQYLRERAASRDDELLLGAKMVGRWQSGAPLAVTPERDDAELGADPQPQQRLLLRRRSARLQVPGRLARPTGQPAGRAGRRGQRRRPAAPDDPPRDELRPDAAGRRARRRRRSIAASSSCSPGRTSIDSSSSSRRNGSTTASSSARRPRRIRWSDRTTGRARSRSRRRPIRRRLTELPPFVVTRGGEYCFAPGLRALRWLAELRHVTASRQGQGNDDDIEPDRNRPLGRARLRATTVERGRARRVGARRARRRRTRGRDHAEPAARRQRHHDRDGCAADRDPGDDRGHAVRSVSPSSPGPASGPSRSAATCANATTMTKEQWLRQRQDFDRTLYTLRQLRKPIIAAVNGIAYGGGSEIAQSTDFIIASDNATFGQPEAMIGLVRRRRLAGDAPAAPATGQGAADADDRRPDHRAGGVPARHGQRAPPPGRADGRDAADRERRSPATRPPRCRRSSGRCAWARASRSSRPSRS